MLELLFLLPLNLIFINLGFLLICFRHNIYLCFRDVRQFNCMIKSEIMFFKFCPKYAIEKYNFVDMRGII